MAKPRAEKDSLCDSVLLNIQITEQVYLWGLFHAGRKFLSRNALSSSRAKRSEVEGSRVMPFGGSTGFFEFVRCAYFAQNDMPSSRLRLKTAITEATLNFLWTR